MQDGWAPPSWKSTWCGWSNLDKILETGAEWHVHCGDVVEIETRCIIPIWRTFGWIQWHVIPDPPATLQGAGEFYVMIPQVRVTLQGASTGWIPMACHPRATYHTAGCSHLAKSMSWSCHIAGCKNSIQHNENRFSPYLIIFCLMLFRIWRVAAFV